MPIYKHQRKDIIRFDEVTRLINLLPDPKEKALVALLYLFGARPCEIFDVQRKDIKWDTDKLHIRFPTRKKRKNKPELIVASRVPFCYINDPLSKYVIEYIRDRPDEEYVFRLGSSVKSQTVMVNRKLQAHNPTLCQYLFRKTRNTLIAENGGTESQLVIWNGWADGRPAKHYVQHTKRLMDTVPSPRSDEDDTNS